MKANKWAVFEGKWLLAKAKPDMRATVAVIGTR
jgi:hypothetical protein